MAGFDNLSNEELREKVQDLERRIEQLQSAQHMKDFFVFVYPAGEFQDIYDGLFQKFAKARPGQFVALTNNELALLTDVQIFPKR